MTSDLLRFPLVLASLIPAMLLLAALFVTKKSPFKAASIVTVLAVELSVFAVGLHGLLSVTSGPERKARLIDMRGMVQLELVSCCMLVLVCTLAVVVVRYSQVYLAREGGLVRYTRSLLLTLAAVTILVISNHLGLMIAGWMATAIGLHQLLMFYPKRRQAVIVAHKKFLLGQIAMLCFIASLWMVQSEVGSLHIDIVNAFADAHPGLTPPLHLAMVLLVMGVLLKTAQLPFHGWLLQVMEAPTPVSALLHAGIVNIGGFVMIRLAPLMGRATLAEGILLWVGLITAIVGSLVMTTRASIKVSLAWSTIAQMGFMLVQCGLGVWHLALLHLLAHSLYKAHAFLGSGGIVDAWRGTSLITAKTPSLGYSAAATAIVGVGAIPLWIAFKLSPLHSSTSLVTFSIALGLSFVPMCAKALKAGGRSFVLAGVYALGASVSYFALHALFEAVGPSLAIEAPAHSLKWGVVIIGLVVLFLAQTTLQTRPSSRLAQLIQPHLGGGLYIDEWFTRLTFRLWPPRLERPATTSRQSSVTLEAR